MGTDSLSAIAFDLDGTLYPDTQMVLPSLGLALRHLRLLLALDRSRRRLRQIGVVQDFHQEQANLVAQELGVTAEAARERIERTIYTDWFRNFRRFRVFPGVVEVVRECRTLGLKTAVMSDFPIRNRLEDLNLGGLWDVAFSSEEVGALKPHPLCFQELVRRLDCPAQRVLYVGNDYDYDVVGAKDAGLMAAHLTRSPRAEGRADFSFSEYSQLLEWLKGSFLDRRDGLD